MSETGGGKAGNSVEVFIAFLRLGLTSFGGPVAHLGYFRAEFVERRRWLSERNYLDLIALAQFLPGPASSQTGFVIGLIRAGYAGAFAAWLGFTLPSAMLMLVFAYGAGSITDSALGLGLLHGLKLAAVAIIAQAVSGMARNLGPDARRASIAFLAFILLLFFSSSLAQIGTIILGGAGGLIFCRKAMPVNDDDAFPAVVSRQAGIACIAMFFMLLGFACFKLPWGTSALFSAFYRSGAFVFGGGHVVLPLLRDAVVVPGWVSGGSFLAGYGAAQALPGPLFTVATYLGFVASTPLQGLRGAGIATVAIFLPGLLAMLGVLPFWRALRAKPSAQAAMQGVNAAVVGLLAAALYPVFRSAVLAPADFAIAIACFFLLTVWRAPPLLVVAIAAIAGMGLVMAG